MLFTCLAHAYLSQAGVFWSSVDCSVVPPSYVRRVDDVDGQRLIYSEVGRPL